MLRFTIRDVLWLTVVVAVGAAWMADRYQIAKYRQMMMTSLWLITKEDDRGMALQPGKKAVVEMDEQGVVTVHPAR